MAFRGSRLRRCSRSRRLPFAIQRIQTDNDSSFGPQFTWHLADLDIAHRYIPPASPEVNSKVERSHKTDADEFYRGKQFPIGSS